MKAGDNAPTQIEQRIATYVATVPAAVTWLLINAARFSKSKGTYIEVTGHPDHGDCVLVTITGTPKDPPVDVTRQVHISYPASFASSAANALVEE